MQSAQGASSLVAVGAVGQYIQRVGACEGLAWVEGPGGDIVPEVGAAERPKQRQGEEEKRKQEAAFSRPDRAGLPSFRLPASLLTHGLPPLPMAGGGRETI